MLFRRLTPENQAQLHIAKAREYWRMDRLDLANAAMELALRAGVAPGPLYDFQRMLEAELGARQAATMFRIAENLIIEADPRRWGGYWPVILETSASAARQVESTLDVRWAKPVLLTLVPVDEWVAFMRARYGYYAVRTDSHKICLPPCAVRSATGLRRAVLHEATHAAVNQLAGEDVPRWLNEGLAVTMEGGAPWDGPARRLRLDEISAGFERWDVDLGSPRSHLSYAGAGEFVGQIARRFRMEGMRRLLTLIREGVSVERAVGQIGGEWLRRLEHEWIAGRLH